MFNSIRVAAVVAVIGALFVVGPAAASADTVKVRQDGDAGWDFNPDPANATPYHFSLAEASIGAGSLFVEPIGSTPAHKFIANYPMGTLVSDLQSLSYDFMIAGNGTIADANEFYLNVYTNYPSSSTFYDCRFDYSPATGSTTSFTTKTVSPTDVPTFVRTRTLATPLCPTTLAGMPAGSTISFVALNVGDTTALDSGLAGYYDNVVVSQSSGSTTFDFEPSKDACKNGGFAVGGYKNQGQCVSAVNNS
jgi:hypothetical protein